MLTAMPIDTSVAPHWPATTRIASAAGRSAIGDRRCRQNILNRRVRQHVKRADDCDAANQRERHAALRPLDLARHRDDVAPSVVGPQRRDQRNHEAGKAAARSREVSREVVPRAVMPRSSKAKARDHENQQALEPRQQKLHIRGFSCADDVETGDQPRHRNGKDLPPEQMRKGWPRKRTEDCEGPQNARQSRRDRCERSGLGDRNLRPHVEEAGKIAIGLAKKGILAAVARMRGCDLCISHRTEEREQAADDPHRIDCARRAHRSHHLARHQKDAAADDDAHDDGGRVRRVQNAGKFRLGLWHRFSESSISRLKTPRSALGNGVS